MGTPLRLLLVEDSANDAILLVRELKKHGYNVFYELVQDAAAMTAALSNREWDVVISDYVLPGFSGLDALRLLKKNFADIPCIIMSGRIDDETAVAAMKAGAKDYVMKGNLKRLGPVVDRELREAQVRRERRKAEEALRQNESRLERQKSLSNAMLRLFWEVNTKKDYLGKALDLIHDWSGCECAGIRIVDEENKIIPYIVCNGFSNEFVQQESMLSLEKDQCACIRVVLNQSEPQDCPAMTPAGSFCLYNSQEFVSKLSQLQQSRFRGVCVKNGYQTIIIIPIRHNKFTLGAIHLADKRAALLSPEDIEILESISEILGQGIYRFAMQEEIRLSERRLAEAQSIAHLGNWEWHIQANRLFWSDEAFLIFGLIPQSCDVTYDLFLTYVHPDDREFVETSVLETLKSGKPYSIEHRIVLKDGTVRFVHEQAELVLDGEGKPTRMFGTVHDITVHKTAEVKLRQSEQELRALSRRLVEAQENERRAIARELHDEVGQSLTALKMLLAQFGHTVNGDQQANLNEAKGIVSDLMQQIRELSLKLRPSMLDDLGLFPALVWHFERFSNQTGIRINFNHEGLQTSQYRLTPEINTAAYRVIQEALTNAARYAGVDQVEVNLRLLNNALSICIQDRGRGFSISKLNANASAGLSGMRERVHLLDGKIDIDSTPGQGTRIQVELPIINCMAGET